MCIDSFFFTFYDIVMHMRKEIRKRIDELCKPAGCEEKMGARYPKARLSISPIQAAGLIILALLGVGALVLREPQAPQESTSTQRTSQSTSTTVEPAHMGAEHAENSEIVISIMGEVRYPGMYGVPPDTRIGDLLSIAEPLDTADLISINHAQKIQDGQQLIIPNKNATANNICGSAAMMGTPTDERININTATAKELEELPGIGPTTAQAIIAYREKNGSFSSPEQLLEIKGIGMKTYERFVDQVRIA